MRTCPVTCNSVLFLFKKSDETDFFVVVCVMVRNRIVLFVFVVFAFAVRCMHPSFLFVLYFAVSFQFFAIFSGVFCVCFVYFWCCYIYIFVY